MGCETPRAVRLTAELGPVPSVESSRCPSTSRGTHAVTHGHVQGRSLAWLLCAHCTPGFVTTHHQPPLPLISAGCPCHRGLRLAITALLCSQMSPGTGLPLHHYPAGVCVCVNMCARTHAHAHVAQSQTGRPFIDQDPQGLAFFGVHLVVNFTGKIIPKICAKMSRALCISAL